MQLAWGKKVSLAFARKAIRIAHEIGVPPNDFMSCMAFESAETFSPSIRSKVSSATGLIQFMKYTAPTLGTTTDKLAKMTAVQQLDYVRAYFLPYKGKLHTIDDLYMAILWPKAVGKPSSYVLWKEGDGANAKAYLQNKGLDANKDGQITKAEAAAQPKLKLKKGLGASFVADIPDDADPEAIPEAADDDPEAIPVPQPRPLDAPAPVLPVADPDTINAIAGRLKAMNYDPGVMNGKYGGKIAGAIAGFLNDWDEVHGDLSPPKDEAGFVAIQTELQTELSEAEAVHFVRPVSKARADANAEVVTEVAPEIKTQKKGILATVWGAIAAFFASILSTVSDYIGAAWAWFTGGGKDQLPENITEPSTISAVGKWIAHIPPAVWLIGLSGILAFVAFGLIRTVKQTVDDVRTGKR